MMRRPQMGEVLSPNAVVSHLLQLEQDLEQLTRELDDVEKRAVEAREAYSRAKDKAILTVEGDTVGEREARARLATGVEKVAADLADAEVRNARARIASIKARIDIGRTAASTLRAEIALDGVR